MVNTESCQVPHLHFCRLRLLPLRTLLFCISLALFFFESLLQCGVNRNSDQHNCNAADGKYSRFHSGQEQLVNNDEQSARDCDCRNYRIHRNLIGSLPLRMILAELDAADKAQCVECPAGKYGQVSQCIELSAQGINRSDEGYHIDGIGRNL